VLLLLAAGLLAGQTSGQRRLVVAADDIRSQSPADHLPRWTGGRLAGCDQCQSGAPILWTVDGQGNRDDTSLQVPQADRVGVRDVASGRDGALAAVGWAISADSRLASFVAWISPDRARQVLTEVGAYAPYAVTVAPDGTIWTIGATLDSGMRRQVDPNVLRHYSPSGQLLATTAISGTRRSDGGVANVAQSSTLMASDDRIGWFTLACEYVEFSFSAVELGRYTCPNGMSNAFKAGGVALSSANDLLIGGREVGPLSPLELNRATKTWSPVAVSGGPGNSLGLLGFDGLTLVTHHQAQTYTMRRLTWAQGAAPASDPLR
jgi:hypothetical protein